MSNIEIHDIAKKLAHQYGRYWYGYLSPTEILLIADVGAMIRAIEIRVAQERIRDGVSDGTHIGFNVRDNSILWNILNKT